MENRTERVFMCKADWDYHVPGDELGARTYPTEAALRKQRPCVEQCGIVEVEMTFVRTVQAENHSVA